MEIKVLGTIGKYKKDAERLTQRAKEEIRARREYAGKEVYQASKQVARGLVAKAKGRVYSYPGSRCS